MMRHVGDLLLYPSLLGHVLMDGNPTAVGNGLVNDRNDPAVAQLVLLRVALACGHLADSVFNIGFRVLRCVPGRDPPFEDGAKSRAGCHVLRPQPIHFGVSRVADEKTLLAIEHAQALGHVVNRSIELQLGGFELEILLARSCFGFFGELLARTHDGQSAVGRAATMLIPSKATAIPAIPSARTIGESEDSVNNARGVADDLDRAHGGKVMGHDGDRQQNRACERRPECCPSAPPE